MDLWPVALWLVSARRHRVYDTIDTWIIEYLFAAAMAPLIDTHVDQLARKTCLDCLVNEHQHPIAVSCVPHAGGCAKSKNAEHVVRLWDATYRVINAGRWSKYVDNCRARMLEALESAPSGYALNINRDHVENFIASRTSKQDLTAVEYELIEQTLRRLN